MHGNKLRRKWQSMAFRKNSNLFSRRLWWSVRLSA
jgi:hypothetical protein